ncbi:MAG: hypothetical protein HOE73_00455 [Bacteroidetes Order II. Incertae sedis bacterium]|jgi:hypothetical protein|nr:hypothetical protein [Bacteroidetes Order II. bacterium]
MKITESELRKLIKESHVSDWGQNETSDFTWDHEMDRALEFLKRAEVILASIGHEIGADAVRSAIDTAVENQ